MQFGTNSFTNMRNADYCPLNERRGKCKLLKNLTTLLHLKDGARGIQTVNQNHIEMEIDGKPLASFLTEAEINTK